MATPIPENRASFTLREVLEATAGRLVGRAFSTVTGVTTDSRTSVRGQLFVALRGERFDGHRFVPDALRDGVGAVLVERVEDVPYARAGSLILVPDTLHALGRLAHLHRRRWGRAVVVVGGSAGKTTTRAAIASALSALFGEEVHSAPGNLNNRVGVPLVLFGLTERHRYAVVEIGTNQVGEVAAIARVAQPDCAVLTRIGLEHTEGLGNLDAIEAEEGDLLQALPEGGVAVANGDDARASRQLDRSRALRRVRYGMAETHNVCVLSRRLLPDLTSALEIAVLGRRLELRTTLLGEPGALAVAAALSVVSELAPTAIGQPSLSLAFLEPPPSGRLCPIRLSDGTLVLDDSYNSNPASMQSSLKVAREVATARGSRLVLVLGEMRELGADAEREHRAIGRSLPELAPAGVFTVSGDARFLAEAARDSGIATEHVETTLEARDRVLRSVGAGDTVLVKASRGVGAEQIVEGLREARGTAT